MGATQVVVVGANLKAGIEMYIDVCAPNLDDEVVEQCVLTRVVGPKRAGAVPKFCALKLGTCTVAAEPD